MVDPAAGTTEHGDRLLEPFAMDVRALARDRPVIAVLCSASVLQVALLEAHKFAQVAPMQTVEFLHDLQLVDARHEVEYAVAVEELPRPARRVHV